MHSPCELPLNEASENNQQRNDIFSLPKKNFNLQDGSIKRDQARTDIESTGLAQLSSGGSLEPYFVLRINQ